MNPNFLNINNQKIAYYLSGKSDISIVFIHGNSCSGRTFTKQLNSDMGNQLGMLAIDLPGHGNSENPSEKSYFSINGYARVVSEILKELNLNEIILVGCSLGGHIALHASTLLQNLKGILIFGAPPLTKPLDFDNAFLPHEAMKYLFSPTLTYSNATAFARSFFSPNYEADIEVFITDILNTSGLARSELGKSAAELNFMDEHEIIESLSCPLAILHGKKEQLVNGEYFSEITMPSLWKNEVQMIDDAGHFIHWEAPAAFNDKLAMFCEYCKKLQ